jgi:hypothetical protein
MLEEQIFGYSAGNYTNNLFVYPEECRIYDEFTILGCGRGVRSYEKDQHQRRVEVWEC